MRICDIQRLAAACFNPLHCGAVVASGGIGMRLPEGYGFQSPSLRGSGRFPGHPHEEEREDLSFNPLHCGAVVASLQQSSDWLKVVGFQSPSLRGSGRFP